MGPDAMILVFWMFSECWVLNQLFHSPLSLSSRGSLTFFFFNFLHFLKLAQNPFSHPCAKLSDNTGCVPLPPQGSPAPCTPSVLGHQGPPSLWGQQNLQASQLPGLFYFIPGLLDSLFLPLANPCLSHLHRVLCLITTYLPNIFSHTTTNTENLQLLYMGNYPNPLLKKKNYFDTFGHNSVNNENKTRNHE